MDRPKVSLILPSYNVAAYIEKTIESALWQSLDALEIICVDAGSNDGTRGIIEKMRGAAAARGREIKLIDSDKKSYGHQINLGIEASRGKYIAVLETDDIASPDMYEKLYALGEKYGADIVKSTYYDYFGECEGCIDVSARRASGEKGTCLIKGRASVSKLAAISAPLPVFVIEKCPELLLHHPSVWSALYSRDFLDRCGIRFPEIPGAGWADNPFMLESLLAAERIVYTPAACYYYRKDNPASSTAMKDCRMPFMRIQDMRAVLARYESGKGARTIAPRDAGIIARTIDHRALRYAADALASEAFSDGNDGGLIRSCLEPIPEDYLADAHVTKDEMKAYTYFTGRKVRPKISHALSSLAYKLRYGAAYFKNRGKE